VAGSAELPGDGGGACFLKGVLVPGVT
jgi:hypothetical protein